MALYMQGQFLTKMSHAAFGKEFNPGDMPEWSGIYRCIHCGDEIAANMGNPLPPQNHHQHRDRTLPVRWRLLVYAQQTQ